MRPLSTEEIVALNRLTIVARLLAGTTHDVNNALQIIGGSADLLAGASDPGGAPGRRAVERIQAQTARAATSVSELMQFARDRGAVSRRVSLKDVVSKAVSLRTYSIRRAGIALSFETATSPTPTVKGSPARLQQAVLNLLLNAEHASQAIQGATITVELTETDEAATVRIIDSGPGVDLATSDRLFDAFYTTHPVPDASGLGLTAARIIAREHDGDVTFDPRTRGACAVLRFPLPTR